MQKDTMSIKSTYTMTRQLAIEIILGTMEFPVWASGPMDVYHADQIKHLLNERLADIIEEHCPGNHFRNFKVVDEMPALTGKTDLDKKIERNFQIHSIYEF